MPFDASTATLLSDDDEKASDKKKPFTFDASTARIATPASERLAADEKPMSRLERFGTGVNDVVQGATQLAAKAVPDSIAKPFDRLNNYISDKTGGLVAKIPEGGIDQMVRDRESNIESSEKAGGVNGTDWYRVGGNVAGTLPLAALNPLAAGAAGGAMTPVTKGDFLTQKAEQVGLGTAGGALAMAGGNVLAKILTPEAQAAKSALSAVPKMQAAREAGYVVHPAEASAEPGMVSNALSAVGGKIKTQQAASVKNQEVTNSIARSELGLKPDIPLDETAFSAVRKNAGKAYQAVEESMSKLPDGVVKADDTYLNKVVDMDKRGAALRKDFPELAKNPDIDGLQSALLKQEFTPEGGVEAIKRLRFQSKTNLKNWDNPEKLELGMAQRDAASAIEDLVERRLEENGDKATVQAYRDARKTIAKSHDVEAATDASGNVDARKIARLADKRPFTGGLKTIADTAEAFPKSMQNPAKFGRVEQNSVLDFTAMAASTVAGLTSHNPMYALGALAPLARPLARSAALSDTIQNRLAGIISQKQAPIVTRMANPQTRNALAAITRQGNQVAAPLGALGANMATQPIIGQ